MIGKKNGLTASTALIQHDWIEGEREELLRLTLDLGQVLASALEQASGQPVELRVVS